MKPRIFNIQRFSIHDGPGIRTTVFFKGCPLRCLWCSNPESISREPQISYLPEKCVACGACFPVCERKALQPDARGKAVLDWSKCDHRGDCAAQCDPGAIEVIGREVTVDEVMEVVLRDRDYYQATGGGMTLSGGEPLFQPEFCGELLREAHRGFGIHTTVETSGYAEWSVIEPLVPVVSLWLYDIKETDDERHARFTGVGLSKILENLRRLHDAGAEILIRCPVIPEHNAGEDHLSALADLANSLPRIRGVELLPYFDLWRAKLPRLGLADRLPATVKPPEAATVEGWNDFLRKRGVRLAGPEAAG